MSNQSLALLRKGIESLGIPASEVQITQLTTYLTELERWNSTYRFVKASGAELVVRHVLDSLSAWKTISEIAQREQIIDVGSGAGFPGVPLAVFLLDSRFTLLEPSARKCAFLRNVAILGGLRNVQVEEARLEQLEGTFDVIMFRAFSPLDRQLPSLKRLLEPGGYIVAFKGRRARIDEELQKAGLSGDQVVIEPVQVPFLSEQRHLVIVS
jgi:16S rRNA (guanine527-N7)-methyltransferase